MNSDPGTAERQVGGQPGQSEAGSLGTHRGWYSRGYLPHCDHPGLLQAITYRLADSLPAAVLDQLKSEFLILPPDQRKAARRERIEAWLDSGHGCCVLRHPAAAACVVDSWRHFAGEQRG